MNNFWRGAFLVAASIALFFIVVFRPEFLKSIKRSGSKYHLSRLGAASCGMALLAIGVAGILNGLNMLSAVYVKSTLVLAMAQLLAVGFYDSYRNSRLGSKSPHYVKPSKDDVSYKSSILYLIPFVLLIGVFAGLIHHFSPTMSNSSIRLSAELGALFLLCAIGFFIGLLR